jgi:hypothetical protein
VLRGQHSPSRALDLLCQGPFDQGPCGASTSGLHCDAAEQLFTHSQPSQPGPTQQTGASTTPVVQQLVDRRPPAEPPPWPVQSTAERAAAVQLQIQRCRARQRVDDLPILSFTPADELLVAQSTAIANQCLLQLFGASAVSAASVRTLLEDAHRVAAESYGVEAAIQWGGNYQFPQERLQRDLAEFDQHEGSLPAVARARRQASLAESFNIVRVHQSFGEDGQRNPEFSAEDFKRLCRLATVGIEVPLPDRFTPCATPGLLRDRYVALQGTIHRLLDKQAVPGQVFLLPLHRALAIPGVHLLNAQHWTRKKGKPQGRSIADLSNVDQPELHCPINGYYSEERQQLSASCEELYGSIKHPTLAALMRMVEEMALLHGWDNISLWKMDLNAAFNILWFAAEATPLMAFCLAANIVVFHLVGLFGWSGMPHAFQVLSRALDVLVRASITGRSTFYVDDCMGCAVRSQLAADMRKAHEVITGLAGVNAVAAEKSESGRKLEFIGWEVCLDTRRVSLSERNLLKATQAFFCCGLQESFSCAHLQRMASLASRICMLCRFMRPFTRRMAIEAAKFPASPAVRHRLSAAAKCEIVMWRAFLVILRVRPMLMSRLIASFRPAPPTIAMRYDASLDAIAVGVYRRTAEGERLLAFARAPMEYGVAHDSSFQNTFEYLAVVLGLLLLVMRGEHDFTYQLYGDSMSSLAWVTADRVASSLALRANLAVVAISLHANAHVAETVHVPGVDNVVYDGLSRGAAPIAVGLDPNLEVLLPPAVHRVLALCNPTASLMTAAEHLSLMGTLCALITSISPTH